MEFHARGVYFFPGRVTCPLAGVGSRAEDASNRVVLDDGDTLVKIDREAGRIDVENDRAYADKTLVADLMFLADGTATTGERTPLSIHLKIFKHRREYSVDLHRHMRNQLAIARADYEPFVVAAHDRGSSTIMLDRERADRLITHPSLALRAVKWLMALRDHLDGVKQDPQAPGFKLADLSVGFGALGLTYMLARAELASLDTGNATLIGRGSVPDMLREGAWEMKLTALSDKWLPEVVQRDLFVFGVDELPLLRDVRARGLRKGQTLAFRLRKGAGEVALDGVTAPLPNAHDVARGYIEFHMLGGLLAESAERRARC